jgi:hypothetical protein
MAVHIWMDETSGEISISAFEPESTFYEANHIILVEDRGGKVNKHPSVLNILQNVLEQAGVQVIRD